MIFYKESKSNAKKFFLGGGEGRGGVGGRELE